MSILAPPLSLFEGKFQSMMSGTRHKSSWIISIAMAREMDRDVFPLGLLRLSIRYIICLNLQGLKSMLCCSVLQMTLKKIPTPNLFSQSSLIFIFQLSPCLGTLI